MQDLITITHTHLNECMKLNWVNREVYGDHSSWVEIKCLVATSLNSKRLIR